MKKFVSILAVAAVLAACNKPEVVEETPDVVLEPIITRALSLNFNQGDQIGVKIVTEDGQAYVENQKFTYGANVFTGNLKWYAEGGKTSTVIAYYPYQESFPTSFTVAADQSAGTESSDFMTAVETKVYPTSAPVMTKFRHQFAQLNIVVNADFAVEVESIVLKNINPTATVSIDEAGVVTVAADPAAEKINIIPEAITPSKKYAAVVAPQDLADMGLSVKVKNGATVVSGVKEATLKAGYSYTLTVSVSADQVNAQISGDIQDWQNGGNLDGDTPVVEGPVFEEFEGYFNYHGKKYTTAVINGKTWMTEPMAYVPEGMSASSTYNDPEAKIFYPYASDGTTATPLTSDEDVKEMGLLYMVEAAYGATITKENCRSFEACQGICPDGWHIPTRAEFYALCGTSNASSFAEDNESGTQTNSSAYFWDATAGYATIGKFNEAGFNYTMSGCVYSGSARTILATSTTCSIASMVGKLAMNYTMTSTARGINSKDRPEFFMLMTTFTSVNNLGKVSLAQGDYTLVAASLRCVKD